MQKAQQSCYICKTITLQSSLHQLSCPTYNKIGDNLHLQSKSICNLCAAIMANIDLFVNQNEVSYGNYGYRNEVLGQLEIVEIGRRFGSGVGGSIKEKVGFEGEERGRSFSENGTLSVRKFQKMRKTIEEENGSPYINYLTNEIKQHSLFNQSSLPKPLQYLVYLSSKSKQTQSSMKKSQTTSTTTFITNQQRHQKIKNILLFLVEKIEMSRQDLDQMIVLVNCLMCIMDGVRVCSVVMELHRILIRCGGVFGWSIFGGGWEGRVCVDKIWVRVQLVLRYRYLQNQKLQHLIHKVNQTDPYQIPKNYKKSLSKFLGTLDLTPQKQSILPQYEMLIYNQFKHQANNYSLILKTLVEEEKLIYDKIIKIQERHKNEKEEYINKIVKLSNRVQELQKELEAKNYSNSEKKTEESVFEGTEMEKSNQGSLIQKMSEESDRTMNILTTIITVTDIFNFTKKNNIEIELLTTSQKLSEALITEIQRLQDSHKSMSKKQHQSEEEKSKLLNILNKKQDRFINLITEKDTVIERYQNALWKMESGLQVQEGPLANRIQYIMANYAKIARENEEAEIDAKKQKPKKTKNNKQQKTKKEQIVQEKSNCRIY